MEKLVNIYRKIQSPTILAKETAELLRDLIRQDKTNDFDHIEAKIRDLERILTNARPLEFTVRNIIRKALHIIKTCRKDNTELATEALALRKSLSEIATEEKKEALEPDKVFIGMKMQIAEQIESLVEEMEALPDVITKYATSHISSNEIVVTFGESTLVQDFLIAAAKMRKFEVVVIEDHLVQDGRELGRSLVAQGITTYFVPATATYAIMSRANKVFMSPNAIMKNGGMLCNSGALLTATAAKAHAVPLIVISGLFKFTDDFPFSQDTFNDLLPPNSPGLPSPEETSLDNPKVVIPRFDYIEPEFVTLYITDFGEHTPSYIYRLFSEYYPVESV